MQNIELVQTRILHPIIRVNHKLSAPWLFNLLHSAFTRLLFYTGSNFLFSCCAYSYFGEVKRPTSFKQDLLPKRTIEGRPQYLSMYIYIYIYINVYIFILYRPVESECSVCVSVWVFSLKKVMNMVIIIMLFSHWVLWYFRLLGILKNKLLHYLLLAHNKLFSELQKAIFCHSWNYWKLYLAKNRMKYIEFQIVTNC